MKAENFGTPWLNVHLPFPCDIHFSYRHAIRNDRFKVLLLSTEPEPIRLSEEELAHCWRDFDLIISHDQRHFKYPNVKQLIYWETQVNNLPNRKDFEVTTMISIGGGPLNMSGYLRRDELYQRREECLIPKRFFISKRLPNWEQFGLPILPNDRKDAMFTAMFHIAIENYIEENYFSEKLLDCFTGMTVPIYRGCNNINEHGIDERALIRFDTIDQCIEICNNLTLDDYFNRVEYLAHNRRLTKSKDLFLDKIKQMILSAWAEKQMQETA